MRGWLQGYNAQAATNEQQIVIAAEITVDKGELTVEAYQNPWKLTSVRER